LEREWVYFVVSIFFLIDAPKDEGGKKKALFNIWSTKLIPLRENEM